MALEPNRFFLEGGLSRELKIAGYLKVLQALSVQLGTPLRSNLSGWPLLYGSLIHSLDNPHD